MAMKVSNPTAFTSLLKDGYQHLEEAVLRNINACNDLCKITKTSFGPHGMNKMIVNELDKLFVTSDAATIVRELGVNHPAAKLILMASQQQDAESGDATNFVLIFAGELLKKAADLLKMGMHPSEIVEGYETAYDKVNALLEGQVIQNVTQMTEEALLPVVRSAIASKQYGMEDMLAKLIVQASLAIMPKSPKGFNVDSVRVVKILGGSIHNSTVVRGMVLPREPESMIKSVQNAKIAVYTCPIDAARTETKGTVLIHDAKELMDFSQGEEKIIDQQIKEIAETGVKVLVTGATIGDMALHFINRYGLLAIKVPSKFDLQRLCRVIGATASARLGPLTAEEVGTCDEVAVEEIGSDRCTVFRQTRPDGTTRTASIVLRGATLNYLDDVERAIDDGVNAVKSLTKDGRLLPGAGATEAALAGHLTALSDKTPGLAQYGIKKYAEALEVIPAALAANAGNDASEVLVKLQGAHQAGLSSTGVDIESLSNGILDAQAAAILDIFAVKQTALHLATEAALSVLRVDSIVMSKPAGGPKPRNPTGGMDADD